MTPPCWGFLALSFLGCARLEAGAKEDMAALFPPACESWRPSDSLRVFAGEKLYDLVDGGADVYLEYGFVRAGSRHYGTLNGGEISLEIHEMIDTAAAWGIFSFLAAGTGVAAPYGQEGVEGEDFVIFWKGRFVVLVSALDEKGRIGLGEMAEDVGRRIRPSGRRPGLAEPLLRPELETSGIFLMRGALAFDRRAEFGLGNVFGMKEGVSGVSGNCRTFILQYTREVECRRAAREGVRILIEMAGYREQGGVGPGQVLSGPGGEVVSVVRDRRYLLLTIGDGAKVKSTAAALARAAELLPP